jgi:hypothetical protein
VHELVCIKTMIFHAYLRKVNLEQPTTNQAPHEKRLHVNLNFRGVQETADRNFQHDRAAI